MPPTREQIDERLLRTLDEIEKHERRRADEKKLEASALSRVLTEVQGLRREVSDEIKHVREDLKGVQARVTILETKKPAIPSVPPASGYSSGGWDLDLPASKSGSVHLDDVKRAWDDKLVQLDEEVRALRAEKDAKEALAAEVARKAEEDRKRWWFRVKVAVLVATPLLPSLGYAIGKALHL